MFSCSCPKFQCLYIFKNLMRWLFPIQAFISFVIHFPFKWPRQEAKTKQQQNKTTFKGTRSQECHRSTKPPLAKETFLRWLASLHCLLYFLAFDWLRLAFLFFLNWTVCLFVKESLACVANVSVWFRSKERPRNGIVGFGRERNETRAIFRAVFDSRSSYFAPKPNGKACYAG